MRMRNDDLCGQQHTAGILRQPKSKWRFGSHNNSKVTQTVITGQKCRWMTPLLRWRGEPPQVTVRRRDESYARFSEFHLRGMSLETCGAASKMVASHEIFQEDDPSFHLHTPVIKYPLT